MKDIFKILIFYFLIFIFISLNIISLAQVDFNDESWVYKEQGDKYFYLKNYSKAIEYYEKALQINPKYAEVYYMLGNIYKIKKLFDVALNYYKYAETYKAYFKIKEMYFYLLYDISEIFFFTRNFSNFLNYNNLLISNDNYFKYFSREIFSILNLVPEGENIFSKAYFRIGYFYFFSQNYENSLKYFIYSKIYKYRPDVTHWILSKLMYIQGGYIQHKEYEKIAINLNPEIAKFDKKFKWQKIPFDQNYLLEMEKFINEFNGYYYLNLQDKNKKYNK
ncbi:MAG: tetratricopeptide repeat protein [Spirochaetes bacterium]|nr:tetratricopeptide repeat protein [Spirochaetota bacterium]